LEIDLRFAPGLPPGWCRVQDRPRTPTRNPDLGALRPTDIETVGFTSLISVCLYVCAHSFLYPLISLSRPTSSISLHRSLYPVISLSRPTSPHNRCLMHVLTPFPLNKCVPFLPVSAELFLKRLSRCLNVFLPQLQPIECVRALPVQRGNTIEKGNNTFLSFSALSSAGNLI